jgi:hypothetical protein
MERILVLDLGLFEGVTEVTAAPQVAFNPLGASERIGLFSDDLAGKRGDAFIVRRHLQIPVSNRFRNPLGKAALFGVYDCGVREGPVLGATVTKI